MEEKETKGGGWLTIAGLIALILVLFVGIKLVFAGLGAAIPQKPEGPQPPGQTELEKKPGPGKESPAFCPYCGQALNPSFQWGQFCPYCGEKVEQ